MTDNAKLIAELLPCPFCGSAAHYGPKLGASCSKIECFCFRHWDDEFVSPEAWNRRAVSSPVASAQDCPNCAYPLDGPHKGERRRKWEQATPVASAQVPREPTEVMIEAARPIMMGVRLGNISCTRGAYEAGIAMYDAALAERNANG
jgi:hypothetical protein